MEAMDERRLRLYQTLTPTLGEETARDLVLALGPDTNDLVTRNYLDARLATFATKDDLNRMSWRMITAMGVWTAIAASLFGWLSRLVG